MIQLFFAAHVSIRAFFRTAVFPGRTIRETLAANEQDSDDSGDRQPGGRCRCDLLLRCSFSNLEVAL